VIDIQLIEGEIMPCIILYATGVYQWVYLFIYNQFWDINLLFWILLSGHYIYVRKDVRIHG